MKLSIITESTLLLMLTLVPSVRCWTYIGCYTYNLHTSVPIASFGTNYYTPVSSCSYECGHRSRKYFIVKKRDISADWDSAQFVVDCYCVNDLPTSSSATCYYQCQGGSCGYWNAMSVYSVCDRGTWGWYNWYGARQCDKQCHCDGGAICRVYDGLCPGNGACADTYWGDSCDESCYCNITGAPTCNKVTGQCNCIPGRYGWRCGFQCHCAHGDTCRQSNGECPGQCEGGYWGYRCDRACDCDSTASTCQKGNAQCNCIQGRYGVRCDLQCHCAGDTACSQSDGQCPGQCEGGYWGDSCDTPCDCGSGVACQKQDGQCLYEGCPPGRFGPQCDTEVPYHSVGCFSLKSIQSAATIRKAFDAQEKDTSLQQCRSDCIENKNGYFAVYPSTSQFTCYCLTDLSVEEREECPDSQLAAALTVGVILVAVYTTCPLGTYDSRGDGSCNMNCGCTQTDNWSGICTSDGGVVDCGTCSSGWKGELCAVDVDECIEGDHTCGPVGQCQNLAGSYQCQCPAGYHPATDSKSCVDANECTEGVHDCQQICINTEGSYSCSCKDGYVSGDNGQCTDRDECDSVVCPDSVCTNTDGSYICGCLDGYTLSTNNTECLDIDECLLGNHTCQQVCTNTEGSYRCSCEVGFRLIDDDQSCMEDHTEGMAAPVAKEQQILSTGIISAIAVAVILAVVAAVVTPTVIIIFRRRKLKDGNDGNSGTRDNNNDHEMYATVDEDVTPDEAVTNGNLYSLEPGDNHRNSDLVIHENMNYSTNQNLQPTEEIVAYENITYGDLGDDVIRGNDNKPKENPSNELPIYDTYMEEAQEDKSKESNDKRGLPTMEINGDIYTLPDKPLVNRS